MPNVLITAGPTREYIDPVRYISNKSSGKMGFEIAKAFAAKGAEVKLISGPIEISANDISTTRIETAEQMRKAVLKHFGWADIVIMAAAVADYRPVEMSSQKLKKNKNSFELQLERTPDILAELGQKKSNGQILVGFALETENLLENAYQKLQEKNLDLIIANSEESPGADSATFSIISKDKAETTGQITKSTLAQLLVNKLYAILY